MENKSILEKMLSLLVLAGKIFFVFPMAFAFCGATAYMLYDFVHLIFAFAKYSVYPLAHILSQLCMAIGAALIALAFIKLLFSQKLKKIQYGKMLMLFAVFMVASAVFSLVDDAERQNFDVYYYPPYITTWQTKYAYEELKCDYSAEVIQLQGSFVTARDGFRRGDSIQLVTAEDMTDRYRVEIIYKGKDAEMYMFHNDYATDEYGVYTDSINIWPKDYDYELPAEDVAYMYKHKIDLEYSEPLVVEKIIIYTAYPEKFDTSEIWFQH